MRQPEGISLSLAKHGEAPAAGLYFVFRIVKMTFAMLKNILDLAWAGYFP
jgi:hypothetical protein